MIFAILYGFFSGSCMFAHNYCNVDWKVDMVVDASVLPAMVGSTAETDAEIGARLGVCFTFTGAYLRPSSDYRAHAGLGFGGLIGIALNETSFSRISSDR